MKKSIKKLSLLIISLSLFSCAQGTDASIFNNVNELVVTSKNSGNFVFDHKTVKVNIQLFDNKELIGTPFSRLEMEMTQKDEQNNILDINEKKVTYLNAISEGDYYACAFIDLDKDSEVDANEPYAEWATVEGEPIMIQVREESRWEIEFRFTLTYANF